jgi:hypothetical protein
MLVSLTIFNILQNVAIFFRNVGTTIFSFFRLQPTACARLAELAAMARRRRRAGHAEEEGTRG